MQARELIGNNVEILVHIFQYLNLNEQLKFSRVCRLFQNVIVEFPWKVNYKEIEIIRCPQTFIVTNQLHLKCANLENRSVLTENDFEEFLSLNAKNIQTLTIELGNLYEDSITTRLDMKYKMPNLSSLTLVQEFITDDVLQKITINCPKLEVLCLDSCVLENGDITDDDEKEDISDDQEDLRIEAIQKMKNLKYFEIEELCPADSQEDHLQVYMNLKKLLKLKLLNILLDVYVSPENIDLDMDDEEDNNNNDSNRMEVDEDLIVYPCQALKIGPFYNTGCFTIIWQSYLYNLRNLTKLTLIGNNFTNIKMKKNFFDALSANCQKLQYMQIANFKIKNFSLPLTLTRLCLSYCKGLTWIDLKYILQHLKLKVFITTGTIYAGEELDYHIKTSKTLEYLSLDNQILSNLLEMENFQGFQNLTTLVYHNSKDQITNIPINCPNLQVLKLLGNTSSLVTDLCKFKFLHKLKYKMCNELTNLLLILKHSSLTHLEFEDFYIDESLTQTIDCDQIKDWQTNILSISIPLYIFRALQDFWLQLLDNNPKLHIKFYEYDPDLSNFTYFEEIVNHSKFPCRRKSIKIFGFDIDCQQIREKSDALLSTLKNASTHLNNCGKKVFIVL